MDIERKTEKDSEENEEHAFRDWRRGKVVLYHGTNLT